MAMSQCSASVADTVSVGLSKQQSCNVKFIVSELVAYSEAMLKSDAVSGVKLRLVLLADCKQLL